MEDNIFIKERKELKLADYMQGQENSRENLGSELPVAVYRLLKYSGGTPNREAGRKVLRDELDATICYLQLDGLEYVNETFGHREGDAYIQNFVETVRKNFRGGDTFARIGGDEFCVILSGNMAELINRKVAEILREFQEEVARQYQCSFSYGIVEVNGKENAMALQEILRQAEDIMYECRNRNIAVSVIYSRPHSAFQYYPAGRRQRQHRSSILPHWNRRLFHLFSFSNRFSFF